MNEMRWSAARWWAAFVIGTAAALLIAWLARLAGVPLRDLVALAAGAIALAWLIVLVTVPWTLYFGARQVVAEMDISRRRGITVLPVREAEAARIARRLLRIALAGHVGTALATVVITYVVGGKIGYYLAGFYLLSAFIRPALAYLAHVRRRISALSAEAMNPRDDVATVRQDLNAFAGQLKALVRRHQELAENMRRAESRFAEDIAHARQVLTADLARLQEAHGAGREAARARDDALERRMDTMVRQIEDTLDGISDHQEVQAGLRALVRLIRTDTAGSS